MGHGELQISVSASHIEIQDFYSGITICIETYERIEMTVNHLAEGRDGEPPMFG